MIDTINVSYSLPLPYSPDSILFSCLPRLMLTPSMIYDTLRSRMPVGQMAFRRANPDPSRHGG
jgi:hypothetical protein